MPDVLGPLLGHKGPKFLREGQQTIIVNVFTFILDRQLIPGIERAEICSEQNPDKTRGMFMFMSNLFLVIHGQAITSN